MVGVVFMISVLNLVLGFILALVLERPLVVYLPRRRRPSMDDTAGALPRREAQRAPRARSAHAPPPQAMA